MARIRVPTVLYGTLGVAAVATATYFATRSMRNVSRASKESAEQVLAAVATDAVPGPVDNGEAVADFGTRFGSRLAAPYRRI